MTASDYEIAGAAVARLRAAVTDVDGRAYYHPPPNAVLPYIVAEDTTVRRADTTGHAADEVDLTVHVWTDGTDGTVDTDGNPNVVDDPLQQARQIGAAVADALHGYALSLPNNQLVVMDHRNTLAFYDLDQTSGHGVVQFTAYVDRKA